MIITAKPLNSINEKEVGSKASSLFLLLKNNFQVPDFFCLTSEAYSRHLKENGVKDKIAQLLKKLKASKENQNQILALIRQEIIESSLNKVLIEEVKKHYNSLNNQKVAVRSSATAEDLPGQSFAGQHGTYFVDNLDDCLLHIKHCWASLWTERAFQYRERNQFDHLDIEMAVIIQELIPSEISGVVFTSDPLNNNNHLIIESCFGLGEGLVSGKITPDKIILDKKNLKTIENTINIKSLEVIFDKDGYPREEKVPIKKGKQASLSENQARIIGMQSLRIEKLFGSPQDIEWSFLNNEVYFIQSRPITTISTEKTEEDKQIWSNLNAGEILPDIITPLTWSVINNLQYYIFNAFFLKLGLDLGDKLLIGRVACRAYFNLNTTVGAFKKLIFFKDIKYGDILGGEQERLVKEGVLEIPDEDIPHFKLRPLRTILVIPAFLIWLFTFRQKVVLKVISEIEKEIEDLDSLDFRWLTKNELADLIDSNIERLISKIKYLGYVFLGMVCFMRLKEMCRKWFDDPNGTYASQLLSGLGNIDSAEAGFGFYNLAMAANESPMVREIILSNKSFSEITIKLKDAKGGLSFLYMWDKFMKTHGHHTRGEMELYNARWAENPDYVLGVVKNYISNLDNIHILEDHQSKAWHRNKLAQLCRSQLKNPLKRKLFNIYLQKAEEGSTFREKFKSLAIHYLYMVRKILLELDERLVKNKTLSSTGDIFFLELEEIQQLIDEGAGSSIIQRVILRKNEYETFRKINPPKIIIGRFNPNNFLPDNIDKKMKVMKGLSASAGLVTGPARVITYSDNNNKVLPGEILVAPFTDPGWTPYFIPAAGIVMDMGGLLSHGSIIAREYGIPAVVNVGPATKIIKTGQVIQVDGNTGTVKILDHNRD